MVERPSDLRYFGETFPERKVEPIYISGLPSDAPELVLSKMLTAYGEAVRARTANLPPKEAGYKGWINDERHDATNFRVVDLDGTILFDKLLAEFN
jgi:hypothetical protein